MIILAVTPQTREMPGFQSGIHRIIIDMSKISALFELRCMLREMERDVGLQELSETEMDVFLAAHAVTGNRGEPVTSDQIRQHELVSNIAQATYHRALRSLVMLGLLSKADGYKSRLYVVRSDIAGR